MIEEPGGIAIIQVRSHLFLIGIASQHVERKAPDRRAGEGIEGLHDVLAPSADISLELHIEDPTGDSEVRYSDLPNFGGQLRLNSSRDEGARRLNHFSRYVVPDITFQRESLLHKIRHQSTVPTAKVN